MVTLFWMTEYMKVFLAYLLLMVVWPHIVFYKLLRGKSLTFRFAFCATVPIAVFNTLVMVLGLIRLLHPALLILFFYGSMICSVVFQYEKKEEAQKKLERILYGTFGVRQYILKTKARIVQDFKKNEENLLDTLREHWMEYIALLVLVFFGMAYFSYGAFQHYSYGIGDMYPHSAWIYQLSQGKIFSAGIYPEGMHSFVYALCSLFGLRLYSVMLFLAGIHVGTTIIAIYVFLKEIFRNRYAVLFAIGLFLMVDLVTVDEIYSMARLQWTIPQEFGLFTVFLCAAFLIRLVRSDGEIFYKKIDQNLLIFFSSIAVSIMVHFYDTIMAFFLCFAFLPMLVLPIIREKKYLSILAGIGSALVIACLPMLIALALGTKFQGSIGWALKVITGDYGTVQNTGIIYDSTQSGTSEALGGGKWESTTGSTTANSVGETGLKGEYVSLIPIKEKGPSLGYGLTHYPQILYKDALQVLYEGRAGVLLFFMILVLLISIGGQVLKKMGRIEDLLFGPYACLVHAGFIFLSMYCAKNLGMVNLVEKARVCSITQLVMVSVCAVVLDLVLPFAVRKFTFRVQNLIGIGLVFCIYVVTMASGTFRGYAYYDINSYNGVTLATYAITREMPKGSFTIVAPTDILYAVVPYGHHVELMDFARNSQGNNFTISTEYVYLFIEKNPIQYAQSHFFDGPQWLASEKYDLIWTGTTSCCPHIIQSRISEDKTQISPMLTPGFNVAYTNLDHRTALEAMTYEWCLKFEKRYPGELHKYYEDNNIICYYFKQTPDCPYQLAFR